MVRLILASASLRRLALLAQIGVIADAVDAAEVDEEPRIGELAAPCAVRLAGAKAEVVAFRHPGDVVLAADTIVAVGRRILPKAEVEAQARYCLRLLSGRRHRVLTAVCAIDRDGRRYGRMSTTVVTFKRLEPLEIERYIAAGEWHGKAGGYAIQGSAEALVRTIAGSWSGVVGLPLFETRALLRRVGVDVAV